jgi:hypothetical protein
MTVSNPSTRSSSSTTGLYAKAIGSIVVTGLTAYIAASADGSVSATEWITIVIAIVAALVVIWAIPSTPVWLARGGKAIAAAVIAALSSIIIGLEDGGLSQAEIITAIVAFLTSLGLVAISPNAASSDPTDARGKIVPIDYQTKQTIAGNPGITPPRAAG